MLKLRVERLTDDNVSGSTALVDPLSLSGAGITEGTAVELSSQRGRRLLARVAPGLPGRGRGWVRLGRFQLQMLKLGLDEEIELRPVEAEPAQRLVIEPLAPIAGTLTELEREIGRQLTERQQLACAGMFLAVNLDDAGRAALMRAVTVEPKFAHVCATTKVVLRPGAARTGVAANTVTFDDVGGLHSEIDQIRELVECPLRYPRVYEKLGIDPPRGILLYGPPGVGKTHLSRAIANELGVHFVYINGPEIVSSVHGGTEANMRRVFDEAMEHSPSIVLIDELDAIAPQRENGGSQADVRVGTQLLSLLDGLVSLEDIIVIGTTNRVNAVDSALRRPGRFDREIYVGPPSADARLEILNIHTRRMPLTDDAAESLPELARLSHGFVGADLMELVRRAGLNALRRVAGPGFNALPGASDEVQVRVGKDDLLAAFQQTAPSALRETLTHVPDVGWGDIGGLQDIVDRLRDAVEMPLKHPDAFARLKVRPASGVLLYGPPGTGKTMLAKAVAKECGANFIPVIGPEIFSKWLGQSEEAVRHIFRMARQVAPAVIFFDQIDAIAPRRQAEAATPTSERVVNQLLAEMDGMQPSAQIVVLAATNRRDLLDPALLRHGRLGLELRVEPPSQAGREQILELHLKGVPRDATTDWQTIVPWLAEQTEGFSGADLAALCEQAKLRALRRQHFSLAAVLAGSDLLAVLDDLSETRAAASVAATTH